MKNNLAVAMGRVSTALQRQEGSSLTDQDITFTSYAEKHGHAIVQGFSFNESASISKKRTRFQEVISYIKANDIGHLYVENTTRLSRDTVDLQYIKDLYENHGVTFHFITENYTLNKNLEGASKMFLIMRLMQGEMMIDDLRKKMKDSMLKRIERGVWPMRPIYGSKLVDKHLEWTRGSDIVVMAYEARVKGATLSEIRGLIIERKALPPRGTKWNVQTLEKMLKQVGYNGKICWNGIVYESKHSKLISDELFQKVQHTFTQTSRKNVKNGQILSGLIRLPNGRLFSPEIQKGRVYYSAVQGEGQKKVWLSEEKAFSLINPQIAALKWTSDFGEFVRETAKDMVSMQKTNADKMIWKREKELSELRGKVMQLYDDKLDGTITKEHYKTKAAEIEAHQVRLEAELRGLRADDRQFLKHVEQITDAFETLPKDYSEADEAGKVAILRDLCNAFTYKDGEIIPAYKDTFALFINSKAFRQKPRLRKSALKTDGQENRARVWVRDSSTMRPLLEEFRTLLAA